jgi:CubicO group peptidase (beta-lactamase class C family)
MELSLIDDLAGRAMRSGRRAGLVIGYLAGGEERVSGYGRVGPGDPDTPGPATVFEIGSITKVFTGLLLADLAAAGVVSLDDSVARYLPVPEGWEMTLADLSSHTAGLGRNPRGTLRRWLRDRHNPFASLSVSDVHQGLARTRLRRWAGERARYSNLGAGLLGQALERAAGQPYEQLAKERICRPLGMPDTVIVPSAEQAARMAVGHTRRGRPVPPFEIPALPGAGALRSTAADMLRFLAANLDPAHTPLVGPLERIQQPRHRKGRRMQVGLGWLIARSPEPAGPLLWHNGGTSGFRSFAAVARDRRIAVVVLSNTARMVDPIGLRLVRELSPGTG